VDNLDPLERFKETIAQALYHAEMNSELIRVRPLLRRALNITDDKLKEKRNNGQHPA